MAGLTGIAGRVLIRALSEAADISRGGDNNNVLDVHRVGQRRTEGPIVKSLVG